MGLLDRLRPQPDWKHPDADVRLGAVASLDPTEGEILVDVAKADPDARVRRAAVRRLAEPGVLTDIARQDPDHGVREEASRRLLAGALDAADAAPALAALEGLTDGRAFVTVAKSAALESVSLAALARVDEPKARASIARRSAHAATRLEALAAVSDVQELATIAARTEHRDVGLAALDRIDDADLLARLASRAHNKAVARRAAQMVRQQASGPPAPESPVRTDRQAQTELCEGLDGLLSVDDPEQIESLLTAAIESWNDLVPDVDDHLADRFGAATVAVRERQARLRAERAERERAAEERARDLAARVALCEALEHARGDEAEAFLAGVRADWEALPAGAGATALAERFVRACQACERQRERWQAALTHASRLGQELDALVEQGGLLRDEPDALARWSALSREWSSLPAAVVATQGDRAELVRRLEERAAERAAAAQADRERRQRASLVRLEQLCQDVEAVLASEGATLKDAERRLRQLKSMIDSPPHLPTAADSDTMAERLKGLYGRLAPRVQELHRVDEWERWANVTVQEELCARVEALRSVADPLEVARQLRDIEQRWRQASAVPREKAQALWHRYKGPHDELRRRVNEFFARRAVERADHLNRKQSLVARAEALATSSDWIQTAAAIQQLQAEWKTIGPAAPAQERALWERFRAACNTFFTRRRTDLSDRKRQWGESLAQKEALCARVEALADTTDWETAAAEVRRLQTDWKSLGPVKRSRSEAVWQRFRTACERFFERYHQRGQLDLQARVAERDALCRELESLARAGDAGPGEGPSDLASHLLSLRSRWEQGAPLPRALGADLQTRFRSAFEAVVSSRADRLRGSALDVDLNRQRLESLCTRVEALVGSQAPIETSPAAVLAARWREALASNTIGGRVDEEARWRSAAREVRDAREAWPRVGYVPEAVRRPLTERFDRACRQFFGQRQNPSRPSPAVGAER